jgi:hypothetical protein
MLALLLVQQGLCINRASQSIIHCSLLSKACASTEHYNPSRTAPCSVTPVHQHSSTTHHTLLLVQQGMCINRASQPIMRCSLLSKACASTEHHSPSCAAPCSARPVPHQNSTTHHALLLVQQVVCINRASQPIMCCSLFSKACASTEHHNSSCAAPC